MKKICAHCKQPFESKGPQAICSRPACREFHKKQGAARDKLKHQKFNKKNPKPKVVRICVQCGKPRPSTQSHRTEVCAAKKCVAWWRGIELPRRKAARAKIGFAAYKERLKAKGITLHFDKKAKAEKQAVEKQVMKKISLPKIIGTPEFCQAVFELEEKERKKFTGKLCRVCGKKLRVTQKYFCAEHFVSATRVADTHMLEGNYSEASAPGRTFAGHVRD